MVKWLKTGFLAIVLVFFSSVGSQPARAANVSFDFFYSNLSPHGSWMVSAEYGQVWQPDVYGVDWNPYYDGHWVYTDLGWTWVSDYSWGAVPYHYGTWVLDADFGWVWVPGYVWAPSWVVFRTGPDYIGWAPVEPSFSVGFSLGYSRPYAGSFVFVSTRDFLAPRMRTCIVPRDRTTFIVNRTTVVNNLVVENNIVVNRGPDLRQIERVSGRVVRPMRIEQVRNVAPEPHISRAKLQIDTQRMRHGIRVAEPVRDERGMPDNRRQDREFKNRDREREQPQEFRSPRPNRDSRDRSQESRSFDSEKQSKERDERQEFGSPRSDRNRPESEPNPRTRPNRPSREQAVPEPRSPQVRPDRPDRESASPPTMKGQKQTTPEKSPRGKQTKKPPKPKKKGSDQKKGQP